MPSPWKPLCISPFERGGKWLGERGRLLCCLGCAVMTIAAVMVMVDTDFGKGSDCEIEHSGYDSYVDGELVERVDRWYYAGDCDGVRKLRLEAGPVRPANWY